MTVTYLDTSAFLKLVVAEEHSDAMVRAFNLGDFWASELLAVEASRFVLRAALDPRDIDPVLEQVTLVVPGPTTFAAARSVGAPHLRTLDALHLTSALELRPDVTAVATYDRRLAAASADAGFAVLAPGRGDLWWR